jgi:polyhydroxyalkanoate synthesis regulator phasin
LKTLEEYCYKDYYHLEQQGVDIIDLEDDVDKLQTQVKNIIDNLDQFMKDHVRTMFDVQSRIGMLETGIKHIENKDLEDDVDELQKQVKDLESELHEIYKLLVCIICHRHDTEALSKIFG